MSVNGKWYSQVGSVLELQEHGSELKGTFDSTQNPGGGGFDVHGSIDPQGDLPNRALSFSVAWIKAGTKPEYRSVTSYTGQYHNEDGFELIDVVFLLANETPPAKTYASVFVASDVFTRTPPTSDEIKRAHQRRRQP